MLKLNFGSGVLYKDNPAIPTAEFIKDWINVDFACDGSLTEWKNANYKRFYRGN